MYRQIGILGRGTRAAMLGSAALVLLASSNEAGAEGFQLTIGGFQNSLVIVRAGVDNPTSGVGSDNTLGIVTGGPGKQNIRNYDFNQRGRYIINARITTGSGVTVGFQSQHEIQADMRPHRSYVFGEGAFGQIYLGNQWSTAYLLTQWAPSAGWGFDDTGHWQGFQSVNGIGHPNAKPYLINRALQISYITPRFGGFQAGVTFAPDNTRGPGPRSQRFVTDKNDLGSDDLRNLFGVGVNFTQDFDDFGVTLSAGWETGRRAGGQISAVRPSDGRTVKSKRQAHMASVYGEARYAGFTAGVGYRWANTPAGHFSSSDFEFTGPRLAGVQSAAHHTVVSGLTYTTGPWTFGPGFGAVWERGSGTERRRHYLAEWGTRYAFAPGVNLVGSLQYADYKSGRLSSDFSGDAFAGLFGVQLNF